MERSNVEVIRARVCGVEHQDPTGWELNLTLTDEAQLDDYYMMVIQGDPDWVPSLTADMSGVSTFALSLDKSLIVVEVD